jgi:murein DD-endopeptidase MepM/ murein hydrolase activator NlpD
LHTKIKFIMNGLKIILTAKYNISQTIKYIFRILQALYLPLALLLIIFPSCPAKKEAEPKIVRIESKHIVKKGETLETILDRVLPHQSTISIINVLKSAGFPSRRCLPGDSILVIKENKHFLELTYSQTPVCKYRVVSNEQNLYVSMKFPYIDTITCFLKGQVNSTLYESLLELGETPNLVYRYADVFAWEIDFVTDTREGDSFFIYFEKTYCDSIFVEYLNMVAMRYKGEVGDYYGIYYCDQGGYEDYYNLKGQSLRKSLLKSPLKYSYISSYFSKRRFHPILKIWRPHHGLDYVAPKGTPVSSIGDGIVSFKGRKGGYGNLVEIRHKNNFKTRYGHLSKFAKGLYQGKRVKMGELIGYVGSTGLSTGPHLHFELHKYGKPTNPLKVKIPRAPSVKKKYITDFEHARDSLLKFLEEPVPTEGVGVSKGG